MGQSRAIKYGASIGIAGLIVVLVTVTTSGLYPAGPEKRKIDAGIINVTDQPQIQGSFKIYKSSQGGILSYGTGGACLVADLNPSIPTMSTAGRKCSKNADCNEGLPFAGWQGYCDTDGDKRCWVRPGPPQSHELCNKSAFYGPPPQPWPDDIWNKSNDPKFDVSLFRQSYPTLRHPVRWRVVACLNGADLVDDPAHSGTSVPACSVMDTQPNTRLEVFGPPSPPRGLQNP